MDIEGNSNTLEDRHINISRFLEARSAEIGHFTHQLNLKRNGSNKLAYQMVRKHLRRRAMSHNRYRIPNRVRARMNVQELDVIEKTQDSVKCRKSLRKPKLLMNSYIRRSRTDKWMETHLWHAKRMRMFKYFQYKIAQTPNEKGDRACYRFANHECTVYDKSYTEMIFIESEKSEIIFDFLSHHVVDASFSHLKALSTNYQTNKISNCVEVYRSEKSILIGPVQFIWRSGSSLVVLIHPGCAAEWDVILSEFQDNQPLFQYSHVKDAYNLFELSGPQTLSKLYSLFRNLGLADADISTLHPLAKHFNVISDTSNYPKNQVIALSFNSVVSRKLVKPPNNFSQVIINENELDQVALNDALADIVMFSSKKGKENLGLLEKIKTSAGSDAETPADLTRFKTVSRTRYTHRKKDKISKKQKITALSNAKATPDCKNNAQEPQNSSNSEKKPGSSMAIEEVTEIESNKEEVASPVGVPLKDQQMDVIIIFRNSSNYLKSYGTGISVLLPNGVGNTVWRLLSFIACKAIGLNEHNSILVEGGQKVFPNDYPLTHAYQQLHKEILVDTVTKHLKKPEGKRVNFSRINSPFPFKPNFDYLLSTYLSSSEKIATQHEDLAEVCVVMVGRGKPAQNAYICLPKQEDLAVYEAMRQSEDKRIYAVHEEPSGSQSAKGSTLALPEPSTIETSREIIGFLSSGNFSLKAGIGKGRGYVVKYFLDDLMESAESKMDIVMEEENEIPTSKASDDTHATAFLCLIRNVTSRKYYLANLYQQ